MPKVGIVISNYNGWQDTLSVWTACKSRRTRTLKLSCWTMLRPMTR